MIFGSESVIKFFANKNSFLSVFEVFPIYFQQVEQSKVSKKVKVSILKLSGRNLLKKLKVFIPETAGSMSLKTHRRGSVNVEMPPRSKPVWA